MSYYVNVSFLSQTIKSTWNFAFLIANKPSIKNWTRLSISPSWRIPRKRSKIPANYKILFARKFKDRRLSQASFAHIHNVLQDQNKTWSVEHLD